MIKQTHQTEENKETKHANKIAERASVICGHPF